MSKHTDKTTKKSNTPKPSGHHATFSEAEIDLMFGVLVKKFMEKTWASFWTTDDSKAIPNRTNHMEIRKRIIKSYHELGMGASQDS